ncbi:ubiquitin-conjugating enzyme/RWD-like protein [Morchella snyderi]|nr:ubiquitin-conjugating enzyme/RWD-like protein [Morchella snyderi]
MPPPALLSTPAVRRQNLLIEFASLKHAAPAGVYMSLTSPDPTLWAGVIFARKGPYHGGIFKFTITFPPTYPTTPPTILFHTPLYHPLVSPSPPPPSSPATPPGLFSLRHGFPGWFSAAAPTAPPTPTPTLDVLQYLKAALTEEEVLDDVPLSAAEDAGAWRLWSAGVGARGVAGGWEERVGRVVDGSRGEEVVFAGGGGAVRFVEMEEGVVEGVKEVARRVVEERVVLV